MEVLIYLGELYVANKFEPHPLLKKIIKFVPVKKEGHMFSDYPREQFKKDLKTR
jgi:hypothetical protein